MTWSYRIMKHSDGWLGLHEVFYDDDGKVNGWTEEAVKFVAWEDEGPAGIIKSLEMALADAKNLDVLDEAAPLG